jgi:hypothetical protein
MAFNSNGDLSDTTDKAKVYVIVDDTVKPVQVKSTGIYNVKMYSDVFEVGDYVMGTNNNKDKNIIAVANTTKEANTVGRIIGRVDNNIAKVLI